jgi:hypothetical protein
MRIKKHSNKNEYLLTEQGMWVRNFTKKMVPYVDINQTISERDHFTFLKNEYANNARRNTWIDQENFYHGKILIASDGYNFDASIVDSLPSDVTIIGVHGTLVKWNAKRSMNYYRQQPVP